MIIPKHLFEPYKGANSRDAPANLKPVGTGPYRFVEFKPGDLHQGRTQSLLPHRQPAPFRHDRNERRRRRRVGGARGDANRRVRLRLEHAGRGRDPSQARKCRATPRAAPRLCSAGRSSTSRSISPIRGPRSTASARAPRHSTRCSAIRLSGEHSDCLSIAPRSRRTSTAAQRSRPEISSIIPNALSPRIRDGNSTSTRRTGCSKRPDGSAVLMASGRRTVRS